MAEDLTGASDGELKAAAARIEAEVRRREEESDTAQAARFQTELSEVRGGNREVYSEHLAALSPSEVTALVESGQLVHLGIGKSRRRGVR